MEFPRRGDILADMEPAGELVHETPYLLTGGWQGLELKLCEHDGIYVFWFTARDARRDPDA